MPVEFDHLILTRFSVVFSADQPPADDDWLLYRWLFFRDAAASSIASQTTKRFTWLVFFDARSPEWLREEIAALAPGLFTPVWLESSWSHAALREAVDQHARSPFLITTRFDSDDAIAMRFVEDLHARFDRQESLYVNFLRGVQVDRSGQVFRFDYAQNPFISYIEKRVSGDQARTVFQDFRHGESRRHAPVLNVVTAPRWMQVIHGANLANTVRGLRIDPRTVSAEFDIALDYRKAVPQTKLARERLSSVKNLTAAYVRHPGLLRQALIALWMRRGTRIMPQRPVVE